MKRVRATAVVTVTLALPAPGTWDGDCGTAQIQRRAERGEQEAWRQTDAMRVERDALRAQLAEAVGVLGYLVRFVEAGGSPDADDLRKARAFLAKHPEGK